MGGRTSDVHPPLSRARRPRATNPLASSAAAVALVALLVATLHWPRRWLYSGCALESLLLVHGDNHGSRILAAVPLWTILATLNLAYAICSTSWLLYIAFATACYVGLTITCLFQFPVVAGFARKVLRMLLRELHFTQDKIALFGLPALEIDTDVNGLFVMRGVTISLSTLTLEVHGVELGIVLDDDLELAMYCDNVTVALFRRIDIGEVYANIKGGKVEMSFADVEDADEATTAEEDLFTETPLLRAATAGAEGFKSRPKLRESLTASYVEDSSPRASLDAVTTLSPVDKDAEKRYWEIVEDIRRTSAVYQSRARVRRRAKGEEGFSVPTKHHLRAAICTDLHDLPAIPHPPSRSVRVTTLQNLTPPAVRRFLHRLPFLLRLLLSPLGYLHDINISAIIAGGSGRWLSSLLSQKVFKHHSASSAEIKRLERKVSLWLANANFVAQLEDIDASGQIPLSTTFDVLTSLKTKDIMVYRTVLESSTLTQVARLGGADATVTIPSFLLPHHEHIIPPPLSAEGEAELQVAVEDADGHPKTLQADQELTKAQKDEASIRISAHASLPACFDQSLLDFVAALVKATKIIELVNEVDEDSELPSDDAGSGCDTPLTPVTTTTTAEEGPDVETASIASFSSVGSAPSSPTKRSTGFNKFTNTLRQNLNNGVSDPAETPSLSSLNPAPSPLTKRSTGLNKLTSSLRQNLKDSSAVQAKSIKGLAADLRSATRGGLKRSVGSLVNDRWIAKVVGKVAAKLEQVQGEVGYSAEIAVGLGAYRNGEDGELPKWLP